MSITISSGPVVTALVAGLILPSAGIPPVRISFEAVETAASSGGMTLASGEVVTLVPVASPQGYYKTEAWQQQERRALDELSRGEYRDFDSADDAIAWLTDES